MATFPFALPPAASPSHPTEAEASRYTTPGKMCLSSRVGHSCGHWSVPWSPGLSVFSRHTGSILFCFNSFIVPLLFVYLSSQAWLILHPARVAQLSQTSVQRRTPVHDTPKVKFQPQPPSHRQGAPIRVPDSCIQTLRTRTEARPRPFPQWYTKSPPQ